MVKRDREVDRRGKGVVWAAGRRSVEGGSKYAVTYAGFPPVAGDEELMLGRRRRGGFGSLRLADNSFGLELDGCRFGDPT